MKNPSSRHPINPNEKKNSSTYRLTSDWIVEDMAWKSAEFRRVFNGRLCIRVDIVFDTTLEIRSDRR